MRTLQLKNLKINFSGNNSFCLNIDDITIDRGEFVSIIGQNGSGKSTLLKAIAGLTENYSGEIILNKIDLKKISRSELAKKIAYVPQSSRNISFFNFTVFEYVLTGRFPYINKLAGYTKKDNDIVRETISYLNIEKYSERKISTLSGGELQKVLIAAALAQQSEVLLFDEISAFLDYRHKIELDKILQKLIERDETIISVTHDINDTFLKTGKILALKSGNKIFFDDAKFFFDSDELKRVYDVKFLKFFVEEIKSEFYLPHKDEN